MGGQPLTSTSINPHTLGINGPHYIKFPHQIGKPMFNLTPSEPLVLVKKLPCFDDRVEMYVLLASPLHLCVNDLIICGPLNAMRIGFYRFQVSSTFKVSTRDGNYGGWSFTLNTRCKLRNGGILNSKHSNPHSMNWGHLFYAYVGTNL